MRRRLGGVVAVLVSAALSFVAGSWWHAELSTERPTDPVDAPIAVAPAVKTPSPPLPPPTGVRRDDATARVVEPQDLERCKSLAGAFTAVTSELSAARLELQRRDELRVAKEGSPVATDARPTDPRFVPEKIRSAVADAFSQSKVPGRVQGLDCTEWPCIVYGRIRGAEDQMEKLEGAKALAAYEGDIMTVLLWAATDEAAREGPLPFLPGRPEQSLFALAFYPRGAERALTDNIDRRLRSRTAELWNTMSPGDETGR